MGTAGNVFPNSWKLGQSLVPIYPAASERLKIVLSSDSEPGFGIQFPFFFPGNRCGFSQSGVVFPQKKKIFSHRKTPKFLFFFGLELKNSGGKNKTGRVSRERGERSGEELW